MTSVRFEWDEAKNLSNQRKHDGVSFEEATADRLRSSASFQRDGPRRERGDAMKTKMVSHTLETSPALPDAQREHLAELAALPDESIDTSDIPELSDEAWSAGVRGRS